MKTGASNSAFLVGDTIPVEEFASLSSATTLPLNWDLCHHCLCHHHLAGIKKLQSGNLVRGFKLDSEPQSPSNLSTAMCMALKVSTHQGYYNWVTFIDDFSHFKAVYLLKQKSETFAAFVQRLGLRMSLG